jgi:predicted transcriptional regulator
MARQSVKSDSSSLEEKAEKSLLNASEFFNLRIKDVMKKRAWDIPMVEAESEILDVIALLCTNDHVWVVEDIKSKIIIGIITEHDILHALRPIKRHKFFGMPSRKGLGLSLFETAEHIMSHDPFFCTAEEKVKDVIHSMEAHGVRRLPVVNPENNEIVSEVTVHQLIKEYYSAIKPFCDICDSMESFEKKSKKS